jgi:hypothetical protein
LNSVPQGNVDESVSKPGEEKKNSTAYWKQKIQNAFKKEDTGEMMVHYNYMKKENIPRGFSFGIIWKVNFSRSRNLLPVTKRTKL